jgi:hypothetical protein
MSVPINGGLVTITRGWYEEYENAVEDGRRRRLTAPLEGEGKVTRRTTKKAPSYVGLRHASEAASRATNGQTEITTRPTNDCTASLDQIKWE